MEFRILLIRHGQTTYNVQHLLPGQLPGVDLTEEGRKQARVLGEVLKKTPLTRIISSPLERALDTANIIAQYHDLQVEQAKGLSDTNVGHWAGLNYNELIKTDKVWKAFVKNSEKAPPDVETLSMLQQRVMAVIEDACQNAHDKDWIAFVAHADVIKVIVSYYMGIPMKKVSLLSTDNASLTMLISNSSKKLNLQTFNWLPNPYWLSDPAEELKSW